MAQRLTRAAPFGYRAGSSPLHRFPAGLKLLALFALSAAAFSSLAGLAASALLVAALAAVAAIKPWELLRGAKGIALISLFVIIFKTVDPSSPPLALGSLSIPYVSAGGFTGGIIAGLRLFVSFAAGSLLFAVTTMGCLRRSLAKAERLISRARYSRVSLGVSLMLGFLPRFFELWETMNLACAARRAKPGPRRISLLLPLVTERMMEAAARTAEALEARGAGSGE